MIPPTSTIPGSFIPSAMPGAGIFNPVGAQHQQNSTDKTPQSAETMETASEITLHGKCVYKNILHNVCTSHIQLANHMLLYFSVEHKRRIVQQFIWLVCYILSLAWCICVLSKHGCQWYFMDLVERKIVIEHIFINTSMINFLFTFVFFIYNFFLQEYKMQCAVEWVSLVCTLLHL